jgi:hypothetical protein
VLYYQAVFRLDEVMKKGCEEICLQSDLEKREMVGKRLDMFLVRLGNG